MKKTEQLTYSPITGVIYWADVRPIEGNETYVRLIYKLINVKPIREEDLPKG